MRYLSLDSRLEQSSTTIPNLFFDQYMPEANGEFLKVYLYLVRWNSKKDSRICLENIADRLFMTEGDVIRALKYWQSKGLLLLSFDGQKNLTGLTLLPFETDLAAGNPSSARSASKDAAIYTDTAAAPYQTAVTAYQDTHIASSSVNVLQKDYSKPQYTINQISRFSKEHDGEQLFFVLQQYVGHPLSQTEINSIVYFHEKLGFSTDLIEYLFEYCVGNNHKSIHYIEKVAISWAEAGIDTVSKAKGRSTLYSKTHYAVLKAFGITGRNPGKSETEYINRWTDEYCFSPALIVEACNRTMAATHMPSFEYADSILKKWQKEKVVNLEDVKALDASYARNKKAAEEKKAAGMKNTGGDSKPAKPKTPANRFNNFSQRTYDYAKLEQKLAQKIQTGTESK
ncbi:MAG: DnaD domain protein [Clostridiales bacterium]|nr:DnaD domain protein [Clostridiales bacterium]MDY3746472.1 DnaD domain protein [Lachnospiraceae bacterium]